MKTLSKVLLAAGVLCMTSAAFAAPSIEQTVNIEGNKAKNVTVGGASGSVGLGPFKGGEVDAKGSANVNSLVLLDPNAKVNGVVNIKNNEADDIHAYGGQANVNSVVIGKP